MSIKEKQRTMVPPAEETPHGTLWLSNLDIYLSIPRKHTISAFFYRHPPNNSNNFFNVETLKESLSRVLVPFYPLAGRLHQNSKTGRLEINCNGEGALFIEVETTKNVTLAEIEATNFTPSDELRDLVIPKRDYSGDLSSFPLLLVQLTRFTCGGVALGFAQNHQIGDGAAYLHFISSWSRFARGLGLAFNPIHDRTSYIVPRDPPQVQFRHLEYEDPNLVPLPDHLQTATISVTSSHLSKDQINAIKQEATSSWKETSQYKLTTYEVLTAHIWRSACKARGLAPDQEVRLAMPVDGRSRLSLPKGYFGNAIFHATFTAKAGDVINKPLGFAAGEVHKALEKMTSVDYLRSAVDCLATVPDVGAIARGPRTFGFPGLSVNTWAKLPIGEVDFGWGGPVFGGNGGIGCEGQCFILQSPNCDGSLLVTAKLYSQHMTLFQKYLYEYSSMVGVSSSALPLQMSDFRNGGAPSSLIDL